MKETTMIIGASSKPDRYANKAQLLLKEHGHPTLPVNPSEGRILGDRVYSKPSDYPGKPDTVTLYVRPEWLEPMVGEIIGLKPRRVIFNPGTENPALESRFRQAGIEVLEACTLVLLNTGQY